MNLKTARQSMMVASDYFGSDHYRNQQMRADKTNAHPDIILFEKKMIAKLRQARIPFFGHCVWRSGHEQDKLFEKKFSKARAGQSPHNYGMAIDLIHSTLGWMDNQGHEATKMRWQLIKHLADEVCKQNALQIEWGGEWKFYDPAHFEVKGWKEKLHTAIGEDWRHEKWRERIKSEALVPLE